MRDCWHANSPRGPGLEEGLRIVSNLVGDEPPKIGDAVEVDFEKTSGGKAVPVFKKAGS